MVVQFQLLFRTAEMYIRVNKHIKIQNSMEAVYLSNKFPFKMSVN